MQTSKIHSLLNKKIEILTYGSLNLISNVKEIV
jgi:hypothetical protein